MENLQTETPLKWMKGWSELYKKQSELSDEELKKLDPSYPVQLFLSFVDTAGLKVLEFASGNGDNAFSLYKAGCIVTGFDASASSIELLKYRAELLGVDSERFQMSLADMLSFLFRQDEFDVVLANQCLQYLFDNTIPKFREIAEKIKPGGWFIYSGNILPHKATEKPIRFITPEEIKDMLKDWKFLSFGTDEILIAEDDLRGYVHFVARKPE
ncbi:MAG: class I SAM-dependent methyltransferase [Spirochaetales bacterium]|nr:class I SAM-dependent methyltransferase [Spirochaetales bacterium]